MTGRLSLAVIRASLFCIFSPSISSHNVAGAQNVIGFKDYDPLQDGDVRIRS